MAPDPRVLRVANVSGFYDDRLSAAREMLEGGEVDVLTGDYLAELTMLILHKARQKQPHAGYAATFLRQMEQVLGTALARGVRIVTNAGGLDPGALAEDAAAGALRDVRRARAPRRHARRVDAGGVGKSGSEPDFRYLRYRYGESGSDQL